MIRALLFDLDGVLVEFASLHEKAFIDAWNIFLPEKKIDHIFHLTHLEAKSTKTKIKALNILFNLEINPERDQQIFDLKQEITNDLLEKSEIYSYTLPALKYAKDKGLKLALCSNSINSTVTKSLNKLNAYELFDVILSNNDITYPKPNPEIYLKAMAQLNVSSNECLIFEDSSVGKQAAREALNNKTHLIEIVNAMDITDKFIANTLYPELKPEFINLVIPMAGLGSRFQKEGYTIPKPFIPVFGKPMYKWVINNMLPTDPNIRSKIKIYLIVRSEHEFLFESDTEVKTIVIPSLTEGAACTVLTAKTHINNEYPLIIANSDQFLEWDVDNFYRALLHPDYDGVISTFEQPNSSDLRWSYAAINTDGIVTRVAEKEYISSIATTGIYGWKRGSDFVKAAESMIAENIRVNGEFYVCPAYNQLVNSRKFRTLNCRKMWGLGVPDDYNEFITKYKIN